MSLKQLIDNAHHSHLCYCMFRWYCIHVLSIWRESCASGSIASSGVVSAHLHSHDLICHDVVTEIHLLYGCQVLLHTEWQTCMWMDQKFFHTVRLWGNLYQAQTLAPHCCTEQLKESFTHARTCLGRRKPLHANCRHRKSGQCSSKNYPCAHWQLNNYETLPHKYHIHLSLWGVC